MPEEIRQLSKFTKDEVVAGFARILGLSVNELEAILRDKNLTVIEHWVARVALMGIRNGDPIRLEYLLVKIFGKSILEPLKTIEHDDTDLLKKIPSEKLIQLIKEKP